MDYSKRTVNEQLSYMEMILMLFSKGEQFWDNTVTGPEKQKIISNYASILPLIDTLMYVDESGEYYTSRKVTYPPSYDPLKRSWFIEALEVS